MTKECPKCGKQMWEETDTMTHEPILHCICGKIIYIEPPREHYPDDHEADLDELLEQPDDGRVCPRCGQIYYNRGNHCIPCAEAIRKENSKEWKKKHPERTAKHREKFLEKNPGYDQKRHERRVA